MIPAVFRAVNTYGISAIDGTFIFPVYSGGTMILYALSGVLLFKDKLNTRQTLSIAVVPANF